jgi:hypothetical protein
VEPFKYRPSLERLSDSYPEPEVLLEVANSGGIAARIALVQLWLSEGIPHAFHNCPAVYEAVRTWLSRQIDVHAKEISLVGSARLGKSYVPSQLGKPFDNESDLDFFVVSNSLFAKLREEFLCWSLHYENGQIKARTPLEETHYWPSNYRDVPKNIERGFIDTRRIPNRSLYPTVQKINNTMWKLAEKLKSTPNAPSPKNASIRCYSSWDSFVQQNSLNLKWACNRWIATRRECER